MPHTEALRLSSAGTDDPNIIRTLIDLTTGIGSLSFNNPVTPFISTPPIIGPVATGGLMPGGIVAPFTSEIVRALIDRFIGGGGSSLAIQEPISGGLMIPTPGSLGGPLGPISPGGLSRVGGRTPFITMPNGLPGCPSGYHPEKQNKPYCVRNRRMNPLNPRALSRATRRVGGFARAVKRARTIKRVCASL